MKLKEMSARLRKKNIPYKWTFFILGIASTMWFLVRVIPKPSRATYPCMKAAAPFMSSFVIYLLSITGSAMLFKRSGRSLKRSRYVAALAAFGGALVLFALSSNLNPGQIFAGTEAFEYAPESDFPANQPMGEELGIFPGRVVWEWDPDATNEDCANDADDWVNPDAYFMARNNDQVVIKRMMDDIVKKLSGEFNVAAGWDKLFADFNQRKGRGGEGYQDGQMIYIKINQGGAGWLTDSGADGDLSYKTANWIKNNYPNAETSGPMAVAVLDQLVNEYGIPQENIYIGDPNAHILKDNYDQMAALFPDVKYIDRDPNHEDIGRTTISRSSDKLFIWSDPSTINDPEETQYSWDVVENADYLINVATLKAHARAGVTLTAKNHFGTHANPNGAWPLHNGLVCYVDNDVKDPIRNEYGQYRVLTDIMGHDKLGGNTVVFFVEGLWGGPEAVAKPVKWQSAPFNGDWPSSILASQDAVALESVCYDLLRTEWGDPSSEAIGRPLYGAVDDHLHQAADAANWPAGITYDPEGDGTPMASMGVHEHWNNAEDRQYSRNLGFNYGIELIADKSLVNNAVNALEAASAPAIDGEAGDACWDAAQWYYIDQTWIDYGQTIDSSDFFGRYKVSWSSGSNLLYFLVEVTDDMFIDGYVPGEEGYHNYDIPEIFIDEDASGGLHAQDNDATWGQNSENAFSYHINVDAPADGQTTSTYAAMDLDGGWTRINYADHIPELTMKKMGNTYCYEFALAVYDDSYDHGNPEASRSTLVGNKVMGLSLAWCDNDEDSGGEILRDHFFGSVWVPAEAYNDHWMNADGYGRVRLVKGENSPNQAVEAIGTIADFSVTESNADLVVHADLGTVFNDPDGDVLSYSILCSESKLEFSIEGSQLLLRATDDFLGEPEVTLSATDGPSSASVSFKVSSDIAGIEVVDQIGDFVITRTGSYLTVHENLNELFNDPGGKQLSFTASSEQEELDFSIVLNVLKVRASAVFEGAATVEVVASNGSTEAMTTFKASVSTLGFGTEEVVEEVRCYPNPVTDLMQVRISLGQGHDEMADIRVFALDGSQEIHHSGARLNGGQGQFTLDLNGLSPGYYLLRVDSGTRQFSTSIQKR